MRSSNLGRSWLVKHLTSEKCSFPFSSEMYDDALNFINTISDSEICYKKIYENSVNAWRNRYAHLDYEILDIIKGVRDGKFQKISLKEALSAKGASADDIDIIFGMYNDRFGVMPNEGNFSLDLADASQTSSEKRGLILFFIDRLRMAFSVFHENPFKNMEFSTMLLQSVGTFFPGQQVDGDLKDEILHSVDLISAAASECAAALSEVPAKQETISIDMAWLHRLCTFLLHLSIELKTPPLPSLVTLTSLVTLAPTQSGKLNKSARLLSFLREQISFRSLDGTTSIGIISDWLRWEAAGFIDPNTQLSSVIKIKNGLAYLEKWSILTGSPPPIDRVAKISGLTWAAASSVLSNRRLISENLLTTEYRRHHDFRVRDARELFFSEGLDLDEKRSAMQNIFDRYDTIMNSGDVSKLLSPLFAIADRRRGSSSP